MKKYLFCIFAMTLLSCVTVFAQENLYKVVAGDTFGSIAKEFNVSVEALQAANPSVKTLFVGMKLNIPAVPEDSASEFTSVQTSSIAAEPEATSAPKATKTTKVEQTTVRQQTKTNRPSEGLGRFSGGMLFNDGDLVKNAFAMEVYLASRMYVYDPIFLEFGLAYGLETSWANESDYKYDAMSHSLQVPALLGVSVGSDVGANFYVGPYLDFTVASKSEMEIFGEKSVTRLRDLEDYNRFQLGLKLGAEFDLDVFVIGVNYSLGLTSRTKGADATGSKLMFYFAF